MHVSNVSLYKYNYKAGVKRAFKATSHYEFHIKMLTGIIYDILITTDIKYWYWSSSLTSSVTRHPTTHMASDWFIYLKSKIFISDGYISFYSRFTAVRNILTQYSFCRNVSIKSHWADGEQLPQELL